jgi:hypothetical protein
MAVTISLYNQAVKKLVNKEVTLTTLKLMLLDNDATFTAANTTITDVNSDQVSGNGWTSGGITLTGVAVTTVTTNDAKLDADDISVTATGGSIGPAYKAVLYDSTSGDLLAFIDFGGAQSAGVGTPFNVTWNSSGIITFTYT